MFPEPVPGTLTFFGGPRLADGSGKPISLPKPAFVLALRLVLLEGKPTLSRTEAASFLWPDARDALGNLRQMMKRVKEKQGALGLFQFDVDQVSLDMSRVVCDVVELRRNARPLDLPSAQALLDLHGNGLSVPAHGLSDGPGEWMALQARRLRETTASAICDVIESVAHIADQTLVQKLATSLLRLDQHEERAWRALMTSYAATGQSSAFDRAYRECCDVLGRDLDTAPAEATVELFLRHRRLPHQSVKAPVQAAVKAVAEPAPTRRLGTRGVPRLVILPPAFGAPGDQPSTLASLLIDDVIVSLCYLKSVSVVAPYSSWRIRGCMENEQEVIQQLNIDYVAETALFRMGSGSKLALKLFDSKTRSIRWAETFALSDDSAEQCHRLSVSAIVTALATAVEQAELDCHDPTESPTAYYWHLVGQQHLRALDLPAVRRASKAFRRSLSVEPDFAPAHSGMARTLQREWLLLGRGDSELLDAAEIHGKRAAEIDGLDGRSFRELGIVNLYKQRFDEALACYKRAEMLSPQHADTIADFADALAHSGKPEAGLAKMTRALELNPFPPDQYRWDLAGMYFQLGRHRDAIEAVEGMANPTPALRIAAASWAMIGDEAKAANCRLQFLESYPDFRIDDWIVHVPNRDTTFTRQYARGLRAAGFN